MKLDLHRDILPLFAGFLCAAGMFLLSLGLPNTIFDIAVAVFGVFSGGLLGWSAMRLILWAPKFTPKGELVKLKKLAKMNQPKPKDDDVINPFTAETEV